MRKIRFSEEQIIGMIKEQKAGLPTVAADASASHRSMSQRLEGSYKRQPERARQTCPRREPGIESFN